jgi:hypothetical protein
MNTEFCMKCGGKAEYTLRAPNFCPSCGEPFNKVAKASDPVEGLEPNPVEERPASVPRLSKLEYEIGNAGRGSTFGDLMSQAASSSLPYEKASARPTPKNVPGEDVIQQTLNECRSAREPSELSDG